MHRTPRNYGWGPVRILRGRMENDGYQVTEIRSSSHIMLAVTGGRPGREVEPEGVTAGVPQRAGPKRRVPRRAA